MGLLGRGGGHVAGSEFGVVGFEFGVVGFEFGVVGFEFGVRMAPESVAELDS